MNNYMTLCAGDLLLPRTGTLTERGPGWLKRCDDPLAIDLVRHGIRRELQRGDFAGGPPANCSTIRICSERAKFDDGLDLTTVGFGRNWVSRPTHDGKFTRHPTGGARLGVFIAIQTSLHLELGISGQSGDGTTRETPLHSGCVRCGPCIWEPL